MPNRNPRQGKPLSVNPPTRVLNPDDQVVSSATVNPNLRNRCIGVLRKVSPAHGVLPKSYLPTDVTLSDDIPHALGGFVDVWKGRQNGKRVCVKAFRTKMVTNPERVKQVRGDSLLR